MATFTVRLATVREPAVRAPRTGLSGALPSGARLNGEEGRAVEVLLVEDQPRRQTAQL